MPRRELSRFIPSGGTTLDCILGGGWPLGRISNIVGDKSTGKTQLAIEAIINFLKVFPKGKAYYQEAEAAFDMPYAASLGMPIDKVTFIHDKNTVEETFNSLHALVSKETEHPMLYIIDSLDALSDAAELDRKIDDGSYGAQKAKKMSELFRRLIRQIESSKMHLMVISQMRDKIGIAFGEKHSRSGGRALDYYASQIIWLSELGKIKKTVDKIERVVGIEVKAKCKKNKIAPPFREAEFSLIFGYGLDDVKANLDWLKTVGLLEEIGIDGKSTIERANKIRGNKEEEVKLINVVIQKWGIIEEKFQPKMAKY